MLLHGAKKLSKNHNVALVVEPGRPRPGGEDEIGSSDNPCHAFWTASKWRKFEHVGDGELTWR